MELTLTWDGQLTLSDEPSQDAVSWSKPYQTMVHGLPVFIENPRGTTRSGKNREGTPWSITMTHHYGRIEKTAGFDNEAVDVFIGDDADSQDVHVIRTQDPITNTMDEEKCVLCCRDPGKAKQIFLDNYSDSRFYGGQTHMTMEEFKHFIGWAAKPDLRLADKPPLPQVLLVRHAHVADNGTDDPSTQLVRGSRDVEPDAQGLEEAERIGREFSGMAIGKIYTSGKQRARIVADAISRATGAPVEVDPALESWARGEMEGCPVSAVMERMQYYAEHPDEVPPGGEARNAWLQKFGVDLKAKMNETETSGKMIVGVTHLSNIMAVPAIVTGDTDLLPFPGQKFKTCEMLALTKPGKDWKWKRYVTLSDRLQPVDSAAHKRVLESTAQRVHAILRDAAPGTRVLAGEYVRSFGSTPPATEQGLVELNDLLGARMPVDASLAKSVADAVRPAFLFGHDAVIQEYEKVQAMPSPWQDPPQGFNPANFPAPAIDGGTERVYAPLGTNVAQPTPPEGLQAPWAQSIAAVGKRGAFDFAAWTLSREMSQLPEDSYPVGLDGPYEQEFNLEADILQNAMANSGLPLRQLAREIAHQALNEGRRQALKELGNRVYSLQLRDGIVTGEYICA